MLRIARHRLAASLVSVLAAFIVVDGMRRIVDQQARPYHGWAVAVLLALLAYAIAMYILLSSARGRQRLNFDGAGLALFPSCSWLSHGARSCFRRPRVPRRINLVPAAGIRRVLRSRRGLVQPATARAVGLNLQPCARNALLCRFWRAAGSEPVRTAAVWVGPDMAWRIGAAPWGCDDADNCYHLSWATLS